MHHANAIFHRCREQGAARACLDFFSAQPNRHHLGTRGDLAQSRRETRYQVARCPRLRAREALQPSENFSFGRLRFHFFSVQASALVNALRARASRDSTACSVRESTFATSLTAMSSTYFKTSTSRCSDDNDASAFFKS